MENTIIYTSKREDIKKEKTSPASIIIDELQTNMKRLELMMNKKISTDTPVSCSPLLAKRDQPLPTLADIINDQNQGSPMSQNAQEDLCAKKLKVCSSTITNQMNLIPNQMAPSASKLVKRTSRTLSLPRSQNTKNKRIWSKEERKMFYNGLRLFGTDFSMISALVLKHRSQKEVYRRFRREDKVMPDLVTRALQWNSDHKLKLAKGFSRVLKELNVDIPNFNPLEPPKTHTREDGIKPLEYYLLSPGFN